MTLLAIVTSLLAILTSILLFILEIYTLSSLLIIILLTVVALYLTAEGLKNLEDKQEKRRIDKYM